MTDERSLLVDSMSRLFEDHLTAEAVRQADEGHWPDGLWKALCHAGAPWIGVPEAAGGSGGTFADAAAVARLVGRFAAPVPLLETGLLAGRLIADAGCSVPDGPAPLTVAPNTGSDVVELERDGAGWAASGRLQRVPWAGQAVVVVTFATVAGREMLVQLPADRLTCEPVGHLAGEPRARVSFLHLSLTDDAVCPTRPGADSASLRLLGGLARALQIVGALDRVTELAVEHARERHQFGRPIGDFQAVQHHLVAIASQTERARLAAEVATLALEQEGPGLLTVATAKIAAGEAATIAAARAHQVLGALGMTVEHSLQRFTRRLWAWRDEFGSERWWSKQMASHLGDAIADDAWRLITDLTGSES